MTCIVGIETPDGRVVLGADGAATSGGTILRTATAKAFVAHDIGYACAGSFRLINILRHMFVPPEHPDGIDAEGYLTVHWTEALRAKLIEVGAMRKEEETHNTDQSAGLIAYRGQLFYFGSDFQIQRHLTGYEAVGSGRDYALGSLDTTARLGLAAERRVRLALEAACEFNYACLPPFTVVEVGGGGCERMNTEAARWLV